MKKSKNAVKTIKGYAIFNTEDGEYMDNDFSCCDENKNIKRRLDYEKI